MDLDLVECILARFTQRGTKMKKTVFIAISIIALLLVSTLSGYAWGPYYGGGGWRGHGWWGGPRVGVWVGPGWGPWWGAPGYWGVPYPYYATPPVAVEQSPPVYVQQDPQSEQQYYWYYCQRSRAYYPYVKECPDGWQRVAPSPVPSNP